MCIYGCVTRNSRVLTTGYVYIYACATQRWYKRVPAKHQMSSTLKEASLLNSAVFVGGSLVEGLCAF